MSYFEIGLGSQLGRRGEVKAEGAASLPRFDLGERRGD